MVESNQTADKFSFKVALIFAQSAYEKLRKAEKCQNMVDLPQTKNDENHAVNMAKLQGILPENIHVFRDL